MAPRHSPTARLRRLSRELLQLREATGLKLTEAAKAAGWAPSKLSRAESRQWRQPNPADVARLLDVYGVTEDAQPQRRATLLRLAHEARRRGWWSDYAIPDGYASYIGLEAEAQLLRNFEPVVLPGLLQSPAYARNIVATRAPELTPEQVDERVELRLERQERLFYVEDPLEVWAIVSEGTLRRMVGGTEVMLEQLERLHKLAQLPNVKLQMLPFDVGAAPAHGPFAILTFADRPTDPEAVYVETALGDLWAEDEALVANFLHDWERLIAVSLPMPDTLTVIEARASYLRQRVRTSGDRTELA